MAPISEYIKPSLNRGPGQLDPYEAYLSRQQVSQLQTVVTTKNITQAALQETSKAAVAVCHEIGGRPLSLGSFYLSRHKQSKKGTEMPDDIITANSHVYEEDFGGFEAAFLSKYPKYKHTKGFTKGKKFPLPPLISTLPCVKAASIIFEVLWIPNSAVPFLMPLSTFLRSSFPTLRPMTQVEFHPHPMRSTQPLFRPGHVPLSMRFYPSTCASVSPRRELDHI